MSGVLTVARLEFKLRIRAGRWRWLVGAWFVVLAAGDLAGPHRRQPAEHRRRSVERERTLGAVMFGVVVLVVLALALLVAPALAAQSVNGDRERGTLATLQVTRLRAGEIAVGKLARVLGHRAGLPRGHAAAGAVVLRRGRPVPRPDRRRLPGHRAAARCGLRDLARAVGAAGRGRPPPACWPTYGVRAGRRHRARLRAGHRQHPADGHRLLRVCATPPTAPTTSYETTIARPDRTWWLLRRTRSWCSPTRPRPARCTGTGCRTGSWSRCPRTSTSSARCPASCTGSGPTPQRVEDRVRHRLRGAGRRDRRPGLAAGLGIDLALAAARVWLTTVRLRTPTRRLARGQRACAVSRRPVGPARPADRW